MARLGARIGIAVCVSVGVAIATPTAAQVDTWVDQVNCVAPGSGSEGDPYCCLLYTSDAADDDRIV